MLKPRYPRSKMEEFFLLVNRRLDYRGRFAALSKGRLKLVFPFILFTLLLWVAVAALPTPPALLGIGLDASWGYALNIAHTQHLVFGKDVAFTYGPLGYLTVPDPELKWNAETGHWDYGAIDWDEFRAVLSGNGPCNRDRMAARRKAHDEGAWVREAAVAYAEKQRPRRAATAA